MKILLATSNLNKIKEYKAKLKNHEIYSLKDLGIKVSTEEKYDTLKKNAKAKVLDLIEYSDKVIISDDSGLFVKSLNNRAGVHSKRYSITNKDEDNRKKLLKELENIQNREAYFMTVICLYYQNKFYYFEGTLTGTILKEEVGSKGFGYDSIFSPTNLSISLAQMSLEEKNKISHRAKAIEKLEVFLNENNNNC